MNLDDALAYQLFKSLEQDPNRSQRTLSRSMGVSLGKINYCMRALIDKGWVKVRNFENCSDKLAYAYILTPAGIEAKARIAVRFLQRKMNEYEKMQQEIEELRKEISVAGDRR